MSVISVSIMATMLGAAGLGAPQDALSLWELSPMVPGGAMCRAMKSGDAVDTQLVRNKEGKLLLVAGHPDWDHKAGPIHVTISLDGGPPVSLEGYVIGPTVLVLIKDDTLTAQLKAAHEVAWTLPWGHFTAAVDGLGKALDAIAYCPA